MRPNPQRTPCARRVWRAPALLLALGILAGCGGPVDELRIQKVRFVAGGLRVELSESLPLDEVSLRRPGGDLLLRRGLAGRRGGRLRVDFPWRPAERLSLRVRSRDGRAVDRALVAPSRDAPRFSLELEIPHGRSSPRAFLPKGVSLHATLKVRAGRASAGGFEAVLQIPPGVHAGAPLEGWTMEPAPLGGGHILRKTGALYAANDTWFRQIPLRLPQHAAGALRFEAEVRPAGGDAAAVIRTGTEVLLRGAAELARSVSVERAILPTDEKGEYDPLQLPDTLLLPGGPGHFLRGLLGREGPPVNPFVPFRYQTLWMRNRSGGAIALAFSSRFLIAGGDREVPFLRAPDLLSGGTGRSVSFAVLPPGGVAPVVLPIFLDPREAEPGRFVRRIQVRLWGTETDLMTLNLPVELRRPSLRAFLVSAATMGIILLGGVILAWRGGRWMRRVPLRLLGGAATFAAAAFVLVNIPELVVGNLARAALGPFSFLIADLFVEIPLFALVAAYLMRYPHPGALGLFVVVRKILLALTIESIHVIPILMLGVEIIALEGAAWLAGITRGPAGGRLFDRWPAERWRSLAAGGAAFIGAKLLITAASFHLHIFFYRLAFADWYIALYLAVSAVLFTFVGFALGLRLGAPLREVAG